MTILIYLTMEQSININIFVPKEYRKVKCIQTFSDYNCSRIYFNNTMDCNLKLNGNKDTRLHFCFIKIHEIKN